jgi:serine/threonine-protein kinase RsbW
MTEAAPTVAQTRVFAGSGCELRNVRRFVRGLLEGCPAAEDAVLLTSELAANAVVHTASGDGGKFSVAVLVEDKRPRVEVQDDGSATGPVVRCRATAQESGLGLSVVEMLAERWGHDGGSRGRVVWFEMGWQ